MLSFRLGLDLMRIMVRESPAATSADTLRRNKMPSFQDYFAKILKNNLENTACSHRAGGGVRGGGGGSPPATEIFLSENKFNLVKAVCGQVVFSELRTLRSSSVGA